jgi:hypothetical protein
MYQNPRAIIKENPSTSGETNAGYHCRPIPITCTPSSPSNCISPLPPHHHLILLPNQPTKKLFPLLRQCLPITNSHLPPILSLRGRGIFFARREHVRCPAAADVCRVRAFSSGVSVERSEISLPLLLNPSRYHYLHLSSAANAVSLPSAARSKKKERGKKRGRREAKRRKTNPTTSCARLAASGSTFLAMFPEPPRPVVYISPFKVGVSRVMGSLSLGFVVMLPGAGREC